jgi:glycosyltransferase involved in cell wall biosynthesis
LTKRVAFVVQRCGSEVNGGAEVLCFKIAEHMARYWEVEIITTCAINYTTWENYYRPGVEELYGVKIRRFPVMHPRDIAAFNQVSEKIASRLSEVKLEEQEAWMRAQGPYSPELLRFVETYAGQYDAFIFFSYLYATTYFGLPKVKDKAYLTPLAHDEWPIYLTMWNDFFTLPQAVLFNTVEEQAFLKNRFPHAALNGPVVGVAVDAPRQTDASRFRTQYGITEDFVLYVGRIDPSKGCEELFRLFIEFRRQGGTPRKLVLLGNPVMPIPEHPDIIPLGFVAEETKWDALAACAFLVMPSPYESLSMVLLEAWTVGKPVLVNGKCEVLVGQCRRANGGLWYRDFDEFQAAATVLDDRSIRQRLGLQGRTFVEKHYSWPMIEKHYLETIQ